MLETEPQTDSGGCGADCSQGESLSEGQGSRIATVEAEAIGGLFKNTKQSV
jgi:hypothetical protein